MCGASAGNCRSVVFCAREKTTGALKIPFALVRTSGYGSLMTTTNSTTNAAKVRATVIAVCRREQTEEIVFGEVANLYGLTRDEFDAVIDEMLDERTIRSTVIDSQQAPCRGRRFLPALVVVTQAWLDATATARAA